MQQTKKQKLNRILNFYIAVGVSFWIVALVLILIPIFPQVWYRVYASATENELTALTKDIDKEYNDAQTQVTSSGQTDAEPAQPKLPPLDTTLPTENRLIIPKIGVNSIIHEGTDFEEALKNGVWRVNEFGQPDQFGPKNNGLPIIMASHRFGYLYWSPQQRKEVSFYELPSTVNGDQIEVIWGQRKYIYEIYRGEENTEITDYSADLILYTCKLYNSPERIFRYARRIN